MSTFWVSWYSSSPLGEFELHSPWWVSGYDMDDRNILCAAVRADDESSAYAAVRAAHDDGPADFSERFCEQMPDDWSPFADRWPQAEWMAWEPDRTCGCPDHAPTPPIPSEHEGPKQP